MDRPQFGVSIAPWPAVFLGPLGLVRWPAAPSLAALHRVRRSFGQADSAALAVLLRSRSAAAFDPAVVAVRLAGPVGRLNFANRSARIVIVADPDFQIPHR